MASPVKGGAFNPSNTAFAKTQNAANLNTGARFTPVNQGLMNLTNVNRSAISPSGNGYTLGRVGDPNVINPRANTAFKLDPPKGVVTNANQAIQVNSRAVGNFSGAVKNLGLIGGLIALPSVAADFGSAVGYLANLPQYISNEQERDRLDKLVKKRQKEANDAAAQRVGKTNNLSAESAGRNAPLYVPPFLGGQSAGVLYRVFVDGFASFNDGSGRIRTATQSFGSIPFVDVFGAISGVSPKVKPSPDIEGRVDNSGFEISARDSSGNSIVRFIGLGVQTDNVTVTITNIQINRFDGQNDTGGDLPNPNPTQANSETPYVDTGDADDPRSAQYFPYAPVIELGERAARLAAPSPPIAPQDLQRFADAPPAPFAPFAAPPPVVPSPLANSSPAYAAPEQAKPVAKPVNPFSGAKQPYESPIAAALPFVAKPYVAGKSNPSEQFDPVDVNTGLTRSQLAQKNQEAANVSARRAAAFDAEQIEQQFKSLSDQPQTGLGGKSPQQVARENYVQSIQGDKVKLDAYQKVSNANVISTAPTSNTGLRPSANPNNLQNLIRQPAPAPAPYSPPAGEILTAIGALSALNLGMNQKINEISTNTTPQNLRDAAQKGSCDTLNSPSCTTGLKNDIANPILGKLDANDIATASILGNQATQNGVLAGIVGAIGKITSLLNNTVIDRTLAVMNLATGIHNAAMLTRDIGETLGSVVDNVISLTPLRFTNSEGSQVQFTDFIGSNFRAFLISVLGVENYTSLVLNWQKANTIYHSAIGVLNTTQSMLDPISSAVEYGMENVSKIGNSLKEDGVVSENSYPAMDETIRARRVNRFERLNDTLEGAENIASNLSSVTSSAVSIKEDYKQLREDAKDFKDKATAFNTADSEARAALKAELPTEITPITLAPAPAEDEN